MVNIKMRHESAFKFTINSHVMDPKDLENLILD